MGAKGATEDELIDTIHAHRMNLSELESELAPNAAIAVEKIRLVEQANQRADAQRMEDDLRIDDIVEEEVTHFSQVWLQNFLNSAPSKPTPTSA